MMKMTVTETVVAYALMASPALWCLISDIELKAFIGLLILAGVCRARHEPLHDLWSPEQGLPTFAGVMSINSFKAILQFLCFDRIQEK